MSEARFTARLVTRRYPRFLPSVARLFSNTLTFTEMARLEDALDFATLNSSELADNDLFYVFDRSSGTVKTVAKSELVEAFGGAADAVSEGQKLVELSRGSGSFFPASSGVIAFTTKRVASLSGTYATSTTKWRFVKPDGSLHTQNTQAPSETVISGQRQLLLFSCADGGSVVSGSVTSFTLASSQITYLDATNCSSLTDLIISYNEIQTLNTSGCSALVSLDVTSNLLESLDLSGCPNVSAVYASNNRFSSSAVDSILIELAAHENTAGVVDLTGNSAPTSASDSAIAALESRSWTVTTD